MAGIKRAFLSVVTGLVCCLTAVGPAWPVSYQQEIQDLKRAVAQLQAVDAAGLAIDLASTTAGFGADLVAGTKKYFRVTDSTYGAVADYSTDSRAGIQAAVNAASLVNGEVLINGRFKVSGPIYLYYDAVLNPGFSQSSPITGLKILGTGGADFGALDDDGADLGSVIATTSATDPIFLCDADDSPYNARNITIEGLNLIGTTDGYLIDLRSSIAGTTLRDLGVKQNGTGGGISLQDLWWVLVEDVFVSGVDTSATSALVGIYYNHSAGIDGGPTTFDRIRVKNFATGVQWGNLTAQTGNFMQHLRLSNSTIQYCTYTMRTGYRVWGPVIESTGFEHYTTVGLDLGNDTRSPLITNCAFGALTGSTPTADIQVGYGGTAALATVYSPRFISNRFNSVRTSGILVNTVSQNTLFNVVAENNNFVESGTAPGTTYGIRFTGQAAVHPIIRDNNFGGGLDYGVHFVTHPVGEEIFENTFSTINPISTSTYRWLASGSGTDEYYLDLLAGGDPGITEPVEVRQAGVKMAAGTVGSLAASEWDWGDNDTLGYNTLYVRLADGADPDSKGADWVAYLTSAVTTPIYPAPELTAVESLPASGITTVYKSTRTVKFNLTVADVLSEINRADPNREPLLGGEKLTLIFSNANCTLQDQSNGGQFRLPGGADYTPSANSTLEIVWDNGILQWQAAEIGRKTLVKRVEIPYASVRTLNATPVSLVAAPGTGKMIQFVSAHLFYDYGTAAYDAVGAGDDLTIRYTGAAGQEVTRIETVGFLDQTSDQQRLALPAYQVLETAGTIVPVTNAALMLCLEAGEVYAAAGDSPLKVEVEYRVIQATW